MTAVRILGPARVADQAGTHEPGDIVEWASPALLELATSGVLNPEAGTPYCELVVPAAAAPAKLTAATAPAALPDTEIH